MNEMHLHSNFSPDSQTNPEENIKFAIKNKIKNLYFTDHWEKFCQSPPHDSFFSTQKYFHTIIKLKEKYKEKINIYSGVELGLNLKNSKECKSFLESYDFDFSIGSIHAVDFVDVWQNRFNIGKNPKKYYLEYYSYMLSCVKEIDNFNVLGHIDYIDRYLTDKNLIPDFSFYEHLINDILKELIKTNRGIEYNTAGLRNNLSYANPKDEILKRYLDLGGKIITVGSDSHTPETIGYKFDYAYNHLKNLGFDKICIFKEKKPIFIDF